MPVSIPSDCFCVNVGDQLETWSNRIWRSTLHRVAKAKNPNLRRKSIVLFLNPNPDTVIKPLPSCVSEDRPDIGLSYQSYGEQMRRLKGASY